MRLFYKEKWVRDKWCLVCYRLKLSWWWVMMVSLSIKSLCWSLWLTVGDGEWQSTGIKSWASSLVSVARLAAKTGLYLTVNISVLRMSFCLFLLHMTVWSLDHINLKQWSSELHASSWLAGCDTALSPIHASVEEQLLHIRVWLRVLGRVHVYP